MDSLWISFSPVSKRHATTSCYCNLFNLVPAFDHGIPRAREHDGGYDRSRNVLRFVYVYGVIPFQDKVSGLEIYRSEDIRVEMEEAVGAGRRFGTGLLFGETVLTGEIAR